MGDTQAARAPKTAKKYKNLRSAVHRSMAPLMHPYPLTLFAGTASEIAHYSVPGRGPLAVIYACQFGYVTFIVISAVIECRRKAGQLPTLT